MCNIIINIISFFIFILVTGVILYLFVFTKWKCNEGKCEKILSSSLQHNYSSKSDCEKNCSTSLAEKYTTINKSYTNSFIPTKSISNENSIHNSSNLPTYPKGKIITNMNLQNTIPKIHKPYHHRPYAINHPRSPNPIRNINY
jgi:hypothetical protein